MGSSSLSDQGRLAGEVDPPEGPASRVSLGRPAPYEGPVLQAGGGMEIGESSARSHRTSGANHRSVINTSTATPHAPKGCAGHCPCSRLLGEGASCSGPPADPKPALVPHPLGQSSRPSFLLAPALSPGRHPHSLQGHPEATLDPVDGLPLPSPPAAPAQGSGSPTAWAPSGLLGPCRSSSCSPVPPSYKGGDPQAPLPHNCSWFSGSGHPTWDELGRAGRLGWAPAPGHHGQHTRTRTWEPCQPPLGPLGLPKLDCDTVVLALPPVQLRHPFRNGGLGAVPPVSVSLRPLPTSCPRDSPITLRLWLRGPQCDSGPAGVDCPGLWAWVQGVHRPSRGRGGTDGELGPGAPRRAVPGEAWLSPKDVCGLSQLAEAPNPLPWSLWKEPALSTL